MAIRLLNILSLFVIIGGSLFAYGDSHSLCPQSTKFVNQFLDLDFKGGRLKANPQVDAMIEGPEQQAWDAAAVVNQYKILSCETTGSEAVVTVSYDVVGTISSSSHLDQPDFAPQARDEARHEKHQFHVILQNGQKGKLRLRDVAVFRPHVSLEAAVQDIQSLARQDSGDPAVTRGADRAVHNLKTSFTSHVASPNQDNGDGTGHSGDRQPASTFEP